MPSREATVATDQLFFSRIDVKTPCNFNKSLRLNSVFNVQLPCLDTKKATEAALFVVGDYCAQGGVVATVGCAAGVGVGAVLASVGSSGAGVYLLFSTSGFSPDK